MTEEILYPSIKLTVLTLLKGHVAKHLINIYFYRSTILDLVREANSAD